MESNQGQRAFDGLKDSQRSLAVTDETTRNAMLEAVARELERAWPVVEQANRSDLERAQADGLSGPLLKRLAFGRDKGRAACQGIRQVASLPDPIGRVRERRLLDRDLLLERVTVPIGVIGMIFESRPDALVQMLALTLKSGNGLVLKGGSEALMTNRALVDLARRALDPFEAGSGWLVHLEKREDVQLLLQLDSVVDLLIPRGSNDFVRYVMDHTHIPVLGHADGLCSIYADRAADLDLAIRVITDAKCQYPAACNAVETLLVHQSFAPALLPPLKRSLDACQVTLYGDEAAASLIDCLPATEEAWSTEYLDFAMAIRVVPSMEAALAHIARYGSGHTDAILTEDASRAGRFMRQVDSADVFWNCSTRFADGFRFGLGAEVGISTQKIHARGPVGLDGLVTDKWLLKGKGHEVETYESGRASFLHQSLPLDGPSMAEGGRS